MDVIPTNARAGVRALLLVIGLLLTVIGWLLVGRFTAAAPVTSTKVDVDDDWLLKPIPASQLRVSPDKLSYKKPYEFTADWLSHDIPYWRAALASFVGKPGTTYLEVGVFEGRSLLWIMENVLTDPSSRATAIDPLFEAETERRVFANIKLSGFESQINFIKGFSQIEMRKLPLESFDIIYIDGSHKADAVLEDAVLAWRLVKPGGVIIFDDYLWMLHTPPDNRPKLSVHVFHRFFGHGFEVVHSGYQVIVKRK